MKRALAILGILLVATTLFGSGKSEAGGKGAKWVVGYVNLADTDVFCLFRETAVGKLAKDNPNLEMRYADANADMTKELNQVDNFIVQKVNTIILVPVDIEGIVPGIKKANEAGIPVICFGGKSNGGDYTFVGSQDIDAGRIQGQFMMKNLPPNAKILYLQGTPGMNAARDRLRGFTEECLNKRPDVTVLSNLPGDFLRDKGMKITEDWIQSFPQFDAIVAANDQMALGAIQALKVANRLNGVLISGVDGTPDACNAIKAGEMSQSVFQNAAGQAVKCYEALQTLMKKQTLPKEVLVPFESITKENVDQYLKK